MFLRRPAAQRSIPAAPIRSGARSLTSWHHALVEGYQHLELEVLSRLRAGEPKDGPKYDNASALRLLALHRDTMVQEQAQRQNMDAASARKIIDAKLEELRQRVLARREARGDTVQ